MRIVHAVFTHSLFGSERYAADLATRQATLGHEVVLVVASNSRTPEAVGAGVRIERVGMARRLFGLSGVIDRLKPDILHAHLGAACKAFGRMRRRPPAVATLHVGYKARQHRRLEGLIALSDAAAARIQDYPGKVIRIWNWAPERTPPEPGAGEAVRRELGIGADAFIVGYCARLHPSKNPLLLVRAFLAARAPGAVLVMAGAGPEQSAVQALAAGHRNIHILGYRNDAPRLYQAFDLFVLPSRVEQAPLVLFETMSAGLPIIATRIEGPEELLEPTPARLFESEDEAGLSRLLTEAIAAGRRREAYDMSPFDPARQVEKILAFYEQIRSVSPASATPPR